MQIRRSIFETSSSSANVMVMVSDHKCKEEIHLEQPFDAVSGYFYDRCDGSPHIYLTDWRSKLNYFLGVTGSNQGRKLLKRIVKKRTGQDFRTLELWTMMAPYEKERYSKEFQEREGRKIVWKKPDYQSLGWRVLEKPDETEGIPEDELDDNVNYNLSGYYYLDGNLCCYISYDEFVVAIPEGVDAHAYGLEQLLCVNSESAILCELEYETMMAELIFNDSIAINIGGDAYCYDLHKGIPGETLLPFELRMRQLCSRDSLCMRNYSALIVNTVNGNERLLIGRDGTKLRICMEDTAEPEYPDTIDMKITDYCANYCAFCYENSTAWGEQGRLDYPFLKTIPPFVEIAVGGGNPWDFPDLEKVTELTDIVNITLHENDWLRASTQEEQLLRQFCAVGISLTGEYTLEELMKEHCYDGVFEHHPKEKPWEERPFTHHSVTRVEKWTDEAEDPTDIVFHVVYGVVDQALLESMYDMDAKLLILGFKSKGRGIEFQEKERERLEQVLQDRSRV